MRGLRDTANHSVRFLFQAAIASLLLSLLITARAGFITESNQNADKKIVSARRESARFSVEK
jgi:hypothetical protein